MDQETTLSNSTIALGVSENGCEIGKVIDGDTVRVECTDGTHRNARLIGFDTPEIFSPKCARERALGLEAKQALASIIANGTDFRAAPGKGSGKYGRLLFRLYVDGKDVGTTLVEKGLARRYDGGKRRPWCGIST